MGTTTNNGWTYPESTDLVKDGATAIQTLADDIDTTLGVYAPSSSGLTLINTTSFSGVSSQSVNDVFSATYKNYLIHIALSGSTTDDVNMRMRVAGADNSSEVYTRATIYQNNTSIVGQLIDSETSFRGIAQMRSSQSNFSQVTIVNPFATENTTIIQDSTDQVGTANLTQTRRMHTMTVTTSFTGFTLIAAAGNITGSVSVFGYSV
jgi:hypothetical protein